MKTNRIFLEEAQHFNARAPKYLAAMTKWWLLAVGAGLVCGGVGAAFYHCIRVATGLREAHPWLLYLLPLAGLAIMALYSAAGYRQDHPGTNLVLNGLRRGDRVPLRMMPLIFVSTVLTHLCGGSAGREGAALQIGGSLGGRLAVWLGLGPMNQRTLAACGMSAVFSALFGTPLTATLFVLEVAEVGTIHYSAMLPCLISALVAHWVAGAAGVGSEAMAVQAPQAEPATAMQVLLLGVLCAMLSYCFCFVLHLADHLGQAAVRNGYLRAMAGGVLLVAMTLVCATREYHGAGMEIVALAVEEGQLHLPAAFLLKILFTAVTLGAGYKGGEIVPTFFVGATFGCLVGPLLGLEPGFAAAVGLVALFCGVVNCPFASVVLGLELFGQEGLLLYAVAAATSYIVSGGCSLYTSQKLDYAKLEIEQNPHELD